MKKKIQPSLKHKLKNFFKTRETSDVAVTMMQMYILPFMKYWDPTASIDDAVAAFFGTEQRKFFYGTAKKPFRMPGHVMKLGNRVLQRTAHRQVNKDQVMLIAADSKTQDARIDIIIDGKEITFRVTRAEFEFVKDYVEIKEA